MEYIPQFEELSFEQKIGQLLFARGPQLFADETSSMLEEGLIGGMQVAMANCSADVSRVRKLSRFRLFVGADMEDGDPPGAIDGVHLGTLGQLARLDSEVDAYNFAAHSAAFARATGIDFNFGPVVDMVMNRLNPMVNIRSLGSSREQLLRLAAAMIKGYQDNGMITSAKHYPGAGRGTCDPHIEPLTLACSHEEFCNTELELYRQLSEQTNLSAVMTGHIAVPAIDGDTPASCSAILTGELRRAGFKGLLISDSLAMRGIALDGNTEKLFERVLAAGHDLILGDYRISPRKQLEYLIKAVENGAVSEAQVDESVRKILHFKRKLAAFPAAKPDRQAAEALAEKICRASVKADFSHLPYTPPQAKQTLLVTCEDTDYQLDSAEIKSSSQSILDKFTGRLQEKFPGFTRISCSADPYPYEIESVLNHAAEFAGVIIVCTASSGCYKGTSDLSRRLLALIGGLRRKTAALLLIGNPMAAQDLPELPLVVTYPSDSGYGLEILAEEFVKTMRQKI